LQRKGDWGEEEGDLKRESKHIHTKKGNYERQDNGELKRDVFNHVQVGNLGLVLRV
jgi:hypothetical protein